MSFYSHSEKDFIHQDFDRIRVQTEVCFKDL